MFNSDSRKAIETKLELAWKIAEKASSNSILAYLQSVVIDSRPSPNRFGAIARKWQWDRASYMIPPIESLCGLRSNYKGPRSVWETMPRGHDKTTGLARLCNWVLAFSKKQVEIVAAAVDWDQAALLTESMIAESKLNPWLAKRITYGTKRIKGPGGYLKVLTADSATNFGLRSDLVVIDEITHWKKRDLWDVLWSGRQKRPGSVFLVITNAGTLGSWQHEILEQIKTDPTWLIYQAPGQLNSWMDLEAIERDRALLPAGMAKRVLDNIWIDPAEESGYLTRSEIEIAIKLGEELGLEKRVDGRQGVEYVAAIDYGARKDRTALTILHRENDGIYVVDAMEVFQGTPGNPVQISLIEQWIEDISNRFNNPRIVIDPWQMEGTVQRFENRLRVERFDGRSGKANYEMAELIRSLIVNRKLAWYKNAGYLRVKNKVETLADEMAGLVIKPAGSVYRFDHMTNSHDDRTVSLGMALVTLAGMDIKGPWIKPPTIQTRKVDYSLKPLNLNGVFGLGGVDKSIKLFG